MSYINGVLSGSIGEIERYLESEGFVNKKYFYKDSFTKVCVAVRLEDKSIGVDFRGEKPSAISLGGLAIMNATMEAMDCKSFHYETNSLKSFKTEYEKAIKWIEKSKREFLEK